MDLIFTRVWMLLVLQVPANWLFVALAWAWAEIQKGILGFVFRLSYHKNILTGDMFLKDYGVTGGTNHEGCYGA